RDHGVLDLGSDVEYRRAVMHRLAVVTALSALAACGKANKTEASAEAAPNATAVPAVAPTAKPAKAPEKAASRGPEHPVYSLVDNRLTGHLQRCGGIVIPGGSAGMA